MVWGFGGRSKNKLLNLNIMKKQKMFGLDHSLEISLYEYGLIICKNSQCEPDQYFCTVGVHKDERGTYDVFDNGYISESDLNDAWIDKKAVSNYVGDDYDDLSFLNKLYAVIQYHGAENLGFGPGGFAIYDPEEQNMKEYIKTAQK
jgi:hypothetical protein